MQPVTLAVRKAYVNALKGIEYKGKTIQVFEEFVNEAMLKKIEPIRIGNQDVVSYILLLNQTANDNSTKCRRSDQSSLQLQVVTKFQLGAGGSITAEEIGIMVYDKLFIGSDSKTTIVMPDPFYMWKSTLESSRNIPFRDETNNVFIYSMLFMNYVSQG